MVVCPSGIRCIPTKISRFPTKPSAASFTPLRLIQKHARKAVLSVEGAQISLFPTTAGKLPKRQGRLFRYSLQPGRV